MRIGRILFRQSQSPPLALLTPDKHGKSDMFVPATIWVFPKMMENVARTLATLTSRSTHKCLRGSGAGNEGEGACNLRGPRCCSPKTLKGRRRTDVVPAKRLIGIMWRRGPFACIPHQGFVPNAT